MDDVEKVAEGLTDARRTLQLAHDLTANWDAFCDADPIPHLAGDDTDAEFPQRLEADGYAELVPVDRDALEDPFAAERGIRPGGSMWQLTAKGLAVRKYLLEKSQ